MITEIHPKLPMRDKNVTKAFYVDNFGFKVFGNADFEGYLMLEKDRIQIHFFAFKTLDPKDNYGQVYIRTDTIDDFYQYLFHKRKSRANCSSKVNCF